MWVTRTVSLMSFKRKYVRFLNRVRVMEPVESSKPEIFY